MTSRDNYYEGNLNLESSIKSEKLVTPKDYTKNVIAEDKQKVFFLEPMKYMFTINQIEYTVSDSIQQK